MGTSLKVHGLKKLVKDFARTIRESTSIAKTLTSRPKPKVIFINKTGPSSEWADIIDYHVAGETDAWVARVLEDWKGDRPQDWEIQRTLDGDASMASPFKAAKLNVEVPKKKKGMFYFLLLQLPYLMYISAIRKRTSRPRDENVSLEPFQAPPLSPSKRRQGVCHYDPESSPSKRQSITQPKPLKHVLPASERKLLFCESTNQIKVVGASEPMDISLADLSMQDAELKVKKPSTDTAPVIRKTTNVKTRSTTQRRATQKRVEVVIP